MVTLRKSFQEGHRRKFLVVIDDTDECERAVVYAAMRAERTGGALDMLYVISPGEFQHWLGVENIMRSEALETAEKALARFEDRARSVAPRVEAERVIREGSAADEIVKLIEADEDIGILVLASSGSTEGPGPLVSSITEAAGTFPIPVTIVPPSLSEEDIAALA
jgi:nucleotide-binding universal stress UspA family protein